jgi:hypothetical protein
MRSQVLQFVTYKNGTNGTNGTNGRGISGVVNYYYATNSDKV